MLVIVREELTRISTRMAKTRRADLKDTLCNPERGHAAFFRSLKADQYRPTTVIEIGDRRTANVKEILDGFVDQWEPIIIG